MKFSIPELSDGGRVRAAFGWLTFSREQFPWGSVMRAAIGLTFPLLVGMAVGRTADGVVGSLGALWAVTQDGHRPRKTRIARILTVIAATAVGLTVGHVSYLSGSETVIAGSTIAVAVVAGALVVGGPNWSVAGLHLLLGAIVAGGIPLPGQVWTPAAESMLGGGLVLALSWAWSARSPYAAEKRALDAGFQSAAAALRTSGTENAASARHDLIAAHHRVHTEIAHLLAPSRRDGSQKRGCHGHRAGVSASAILVFDEVVDITLTLVLQGQQLTGAEADLPRVIASRLPLPRSSSKSTDLKRGNRLQGVARLQEIAAGASDTKAPLGVARVSPRAGWRQRLIMAAALGSSIAVAATLAFLLGAPRAYWLPLGVAFIFKPDIGPLFGRALNRCLGTIAGAVIGELLFPILHLGVVPVIALGVLGAIVAIGVVYHYALGTMALTSIVFIFVYLLGDHERLFTLRVSDTAIAAGIVIFVGLLLRGESWRTRAAEAVELARTAVTDYLTAEEHEPEELRHLRLRAYQLITTARNDILRARQEPPFSVPATWVDTLDEAERLLDSA